MTIWPAMPDTQRIVTADDAMNSIRLIVAYCGMESLDAAPKLKAMLCDENDKPATANNYERWFFVRGTVVGKVRPQIRVLWDSLSSETQQTLRLVKAHELLACGAAGLAIEDKSDKRSDSLIDMVHVVSHLCDGIAEMVPSPQFGKQPLPRFHR